MRLVEDAEVVAALATVDVAGLVEAHHAEPRWDDPASPLIQAEGDRWTCATAAAADDGMRGVLTCTGGRATAHRLLTVVDPDGTPVALVTADRLCADVVAATAALAARRLERPIQGAIGVIGTGRLGRATVCALVALGAESVVLFDVDRDALREAEQALADLSVSVTTVGDAAAAVRDARIVITSTNARDPVLRDDWLAEGAMVLALGADRRGRRELDYRVIDGAALVVCDSPAMGRLLADDLRECVAEGYLDWQEVLALGDLVVSGLEAPCPAEDRVVVKVIDPTGPALAVARALLDR